MAAVAPTLPAPITVTFLRMRRLLSKKIDEKRF